MNLKFYYTMIVVIAPIKWVKAKDFLKPTYGHIKKL